MLPGRSRWLQPRTPWCDAADCRLELLGAAETRSRPGEEAEGDIVTREPNGVRRGPLDLDGAPRRYLDLHGRLAQAVARQAEEAEDASGARRPPADSALGGAVGGDEVAGGRDGHTGDGRGVAVQDAPFGGGAHVVQEEDALDGADLWGKGWGWGGVGSGRVGGGNLL